MLPNQNTFAATDVLSVDEDVDSPRSSPDLRFSPAEAKKFGAFLEFCETVAAATLRDETQFTQGVSHEWLEGRKTFWSAVLSASRWQRSIVNLLARK